MNILHIHTNDIRFIDTNFHHDLKNISQEIIKARKQINVSQTRLAEMLGISVRTLESWERGKRNPSSSAQALIKLFIKCPEFVLKTLN